MKKNQEFLNKLIYDQMDSFYKTFSDIRGELQDNNAKITDHEIEQSIQSLITLKLVEQKTAKKRWFRKKLQ